MSRIKEVLEQVKMALGGYGQETYTFEFSGQEWVASIEYNYDPINPFTDWDHPEGSGIDLSNHRDYRPDAFGEAAPVDVPEFLHWVAEGEQDLSEYLNTYTCADKECGEEWHEYKDHKSAKDECPRCGSLSKRPKESVLNDDPSEDFKEFIKDYYWAPVYMYDHSVRTVNTTGFSCQWDSGTAGIAFLLKETLIKEKLYGADKSFSTKKLNEKAEAFLIDHVKLLDQLMRGEVYGYKVVNEDETEEDSCWGFWGDDGREVAVGEALNALERMLEEAPVLHTMDCTEIAKNIKKDLQRWCYWDQFVNNPDDVVCDFRESFLNHIDDVEGMVMDELKKLAKI